MSQKRDTTRIGSSAVPFLLALVSSAALAQPAMVTDLNATLDGAFGLGPQAIVASGSTVFLSGTAEGMGVELWKSDGTSGGTVLVEDIWPGGGSSNPSGFVVVGGIAYFSADDGVNGAELWRSDGTPGGTYMLKDVSAGSAPSSPAYLTVVGTTLYFRAYALGSGQELWKSDGTPAGTVLVSDICPGEDCGGSPWNLTAVGSTLFFSASTGTYGTELWKSDGTSAGTVLVKDVWPGAGSSNPSQLKAVGSTLFFAASSDSATGNELWKSDGTSSGTVLVKDVCTTSGCNGNPTQLTAVGGTLFFAASDGSSGTELWKSDGTPGGTVQVKDIWPGSSGSGPSRLTAAGSLLFFLATDGSTGGELWKSDGTSGGTVLVKDLCTGCSANPSNLTAVGSTLYFSAGEGTYGFELWRSDGTGAGTTVVKDICPGGCSSSPSLLTNVNGTLFFRVSWASGELWKSDGTDPGTVVVRELYSPSSFPSSFVELGGTLYYVASDGNSNRELWKSDGTPGGTTMVVEVGPGGEAGVQGGLVKAGSTLYFAGYDGANGTELWKSDGTPGGTTMVKDICPGGCGSGPSRLTAVGSSLYFVANDGTNGNELWKSDGTSAGTVMVDVCPGSCSASLSNLVAVGSTLFLTASTGTSGNELWKSDGTDPGTDVVADICPGSCSSNPSALAAVGGTLFFRANNGGDGWELWRSDGTSAGTYMVKDIRPGGLASWPDFLTNVNGTLFFTAWNPDRELWKSDGTSAGTVLVKDICPGSCYSTPAGLVAAGGWLFFRATDGTSGMELWASDGSADGTFRVKDIAPGSASSIPRPVAVVGSTLFFAANDGTNGEELWKTDVTPDGTFQVVGANPGPGHGNSWEALVAGDRLFFNADDGTHGQELWTLGTADLGVTLTDSPDPVSQSATLTYVATVTNQGTGAASSVRLTVALPGGVTFSSSTPGSPTCVHSSGLVSCGLGTISGGGTSQVTVRATPNLGVSGPAEAWAFVTGLEADPDGSDDSATATTTVLGPLPPTGLVASPLSSSSIRLTWTDPETTESGFRVEISADGTSFTQIEIVGANVTTYTDTGLAAGTGYFYRVITLRTGAESLPSNVAAGTTFASAAAKVCPTSLGLFHGYASGSSVAWNGTGWAGAWSDSRDGQLTEIWFQRLASATGSPQGAPVRVTTSGTSTGNLTLRWNGSQYGLLFREAITSTDGGPNSAFRFALLDANGSKLRGDVVVPLDHIGSRPSTGSEVPLLWNGNGWGVFVATEPTPPSDLHFFALDPDGDLTVGPVPIAATPGYELSASAGWNGSEYGVVWVTIPQDVLSGQVYFQRVSAAGVPIGSPQLVKEDANPSGAWNFPAQTSITWESGSWVVAWVDGFAGPEDAEAIYLRRYGSDGLPAGAAVRLSHDFDPEFPPEFEYPIYDETPVLFPRAGGGVVVYTACVPNTTYVYETCRYEADASLARIGTRTFLTPHDGSQSARSRAATDGSRFLLSWPENRSGATEVIDLLVDASGTVLAGPTDVTTGHVPGGTNYPTALALGSGFGAVFSEADATTAQLKGTFWNGSGTQVAANVVLSNRATRQRPGAVSVGSTFALAFKDTSNALVFRRFDATGAPLIPESVLATGVTGRPLVGLAFSGEVYGVTYVWGQNLSFRRVAPDGTALGSPVLVTTAQMDAPGPQVAWAGTGWALVWGHAGEIWYAFLAPDGTVTVPPIQVTFTPDMAANGWQLLWTGQHLGLVWYEYATPDPPGGDVFFTVLNLQGVKQFAPVAVGGGFYDDYNPAMYWDVDRFRVVLVGGDPWGLTDHAVMPDGTLVAGQKLYSVLVSQFGIAWNGATLGICWPIDGYVRFTTTACLADATPPACPTATAVSDGTRTTVSWTSPSDPESGIWRTSLYRDGELLMQEIPPSTSYVDGGVVPGTPHAYEVRPRNWANLEPSSCTAVTPSANLSVTKTDGATSETPGTGVTYTITVGNAGPSTVKEVTLTDALPAALLGPVFTPSAGSYDPVTGAWSGLSLATGQSATLSLTAAVASSATGSLVNTATVAPRGGLVVDPTASNDSSTDSDSLVPSADLSVTKTGPASVVRGSQFAYTLTVTNAGPSDATGVVLSDPTPAGLTFVSSAIDCTTAFPCALGTIPAGQTRTVAATFLVPAGYAGPDPVVNTATVAATTPDPVAANGQATATTAVTSPVGPVKFHTLMPCRVLDTRDPDGSWGGPAIQTGTERAFVVAGRCEVPPTAKAVSANLTVTQPSGAGFVRVYPSGTPLPLVSTLNYRAGQTRANNAVVRLGDAGAASIRCDQDGGAVHVILDVNGWFE